MRLKSIVIVFSFTFFLMQLEEVQAEITDFTFVAKIRSFDKDSALCDVSGQLVQIKRSYIKSKQYKSGDAVTIVVPGAALGKIQSSK